MSRRATAKAIIALAPCWSDDQVRAAVGRGVTLLEIARTPTVTIHQRRWVLTHLAARTPEGCNALLLWAAGCAQDMRDLITDEVVRDAADVCIATVASYVDGCATAQDCADAADYAADYANAAYAAYICACAVASNDKATYAAYAANSAANTAAAYVASSRQQLVNLATALSEAAT